ncbi:MAG TPA: AzlD domain-containing protein [Usitatibacter sp.]|nr:AzlD domain-containing protein [Usitatibacter sp.]
MSTWLAIVGVGLVTFLLRASFIVFADPQRFPTFFRRALAFVPPAVLAAIVAPGLLLNQGALDFSTGNPRWMAGVLAIAVAVRSRSVLAAIVSGMAALWLLQWGLR